MKRIVLAMAAGLLLLPAVKAQSPEKINYQAVARDAENGAELIEQELEVVFSILNDGPAGTIEYQELHTSQTNAYGLVNLLIGEGAVLEGNFSDITWGTGEKWLRVEMDLGEGLTEVSNTQFISVPYALHAETAQSADNVDDADADPTNELVEPGSFQLNDTILVFTEGGITQEVNLAPLANYGPWLVGVGTVYNTDANIGVGTDSPEHKLHVINQSVDPADSVAVFGFGNNSGGTVYGVAARTTGGTGGRALYGDAPGGGDDRWAGYFDRGNVYVTNHLSINAESTEAQLSISGEDASTPMVNVQNNSSESALVIEGSGRVGISEPAPHSGFHTGGSVAGAVRFEEAGIGSTTLAEDDYILIVDVTGGPVTVTLPSAAGIEGRIYYVKRTYSSATNNTLTIAPSPGETIDGTAFPTLLSSTSAQESRKFVSAGDNGWYIISE